MFLPGKAKEEIERGFDPMCRVSEVLSQNLWAKIAFITHVKYIGVNTYSITVRTCSRTCTQNLYHGCSVFGSRTDQNSVHFLFVKTFQFSTIFHHPCYPGSRTLQLREREGNISKFGKNECSVYLLPGYWKFHFRTFLELSGNKFPFPISNLSLVIGSWQPTEWWSEGKEIGSCHAKNGHRKRVLASGGIEHECKWDERTRCLMIFRVLAGRINDGEKKMKT